MIDFRRIAVAVTMTVAAATTVQAHLPSKYDASLQMGRITTSNSRNVASDFSNKGEWSPDEIYEGSYAIQKGDTVSYGTFPPNDPKGKKLWWWAKFEAKGAKQTPGEFAAEGGTSPWVLLNSLSAADNGTINYKWRGWNDDMENMTGLKAEVPTWKDGAVGAYSMTHDDIGAMPFDKSVQPAWNVADTFPDIKQCWGVYVEKMEDKEWDLAKDMVLDGHEMFNHSMKHTSAADQWQWFLPGTVVPSHDPAIPEALRGLKVLGLWPKGTDTSFKGKIDITAQSHQGVPMEPIWPPAQTASMENEMVKVTFTPYWTGHVPSSEPVGTVLSPDDKDAKRTVIEPIIETKSGTEELILESGQKVYVKYTKKSDNIEQESHEGFIAATQVNWFDLKDILEKYPYYYNGHYMQKYVEGGGGPMIQVTGADEGRPGFIAKVYCKTAWDEAAGDYKENVDDASQIINEKLYEKIKFAGEHFRKDKRVEYYGYPFDAYSEKTHAYLEKNGFVGARGGAKSGNPIPGDFFHPYRIDFDPFYITLSDWDVNKVGEKYIYPKNPHVMLGANQLIDKIIEHKGYMIREFHAVADIADGEWYSTDPKVRSEYWPLNSSAEGVGGWWGGITAKQLERHYQYVQSKIDRNEITVYTVGEVTKYRMTANAVNESKIAKDGDNYILEVTTKGTLKDKYHDEISVIVSLPEAVDSLGVNYKTVDDAWGSSPRRRPRKMKTEGNGKCKLWSVSINPFLGKATIVPNGKWNGQKTDPKVTSIAGQSVIQHQQKASLNGIIDGRVALELPFGKYQAEMYNMQGRLINSVGVVSNNGVVKTNLKTANVSSGMFIINVKKDGASILTQKLMINK